FSSSSFLLTLRPTRSTRFPYTTLFPIYEGIAIAEGVEDLTVDARGGVAGQEHREGGDVVRVALGTHRLLARPLARLLEDLAASRCRVDHTRGATRHDGVGRHVVLRHRVRRRPRHPDDARLGRL